MKICLIGTRWFGAEMLRLLLLREHDVAILATNGEDTLAKAAMAADRPLVTREEPRSVGESDLPADSFDVIVAAHTHAFVNASARSRARFAIGYHPSLLPRHRGIAAVEWTIKSGDKVAGGSVYHLSGGMDAGALAAQDWCFVYPDDDAGSLWRRALAPMGHRLLLRVIDDLASRGTIDAWEQDARAITLAPPVTDDVSA